MGETSHRTVIKNTEWVTADLVQTSRDGNTYKQTFHSLETGMKVHSIYLDCSGMCTETNPPWKKLTPGPECQCGHAPPLTSPKSRASQLSCQHCFHAQDLQWRLAKHSSEVTSLLRANSEQLPNHGSMLVVSVLFLLLMNISFSYGREIEVSKLTCKCVNMFGFFTIMFIILEIT